MSSLASHPFKIRYGRGDDLLAELYLPAFERAVRYDCLVASGSSRALAGATAGLARLSLRGGSVRLLCGVHPLGDETVEAALLRLLEPPDDDTVRARLAALAWMLAHRHLAVRVAVPRAAGGASLEPDEAVVRDAEGHRLVWSGGPASLWTFASFPRGDGAARIAAAPDHVRAVERRFESLWEDREKGWRVVELPAAARDRLLAVCPEEAPRRDPLEKVAAARPEASAAGAADRRLVLRFLREAPYFPHARDLGVATGAVEPWPHQLRVVRRLVESYPRSFLLADEVGLGKTVEAGLALRQLVLSGRVRRALVLVPKNVLRQWQEELFEKAALHVPRFDGARLCDVFGREAGRRRSRNPWNAAPLMLASSHLARRRERRAELLAADPWDLLIVDEAHHARRKGSRPDAYRPNTLLELLAGRGRRRGLRHRARAIYLLTATPMQIHPVEVWDLLKLLGLGGRWGAHEEPFLRFFEELRRPFRDRDWGFLAAMMADARELGVAFDPTFRPGVERPEEDAWTVLERLGEAADPRATALALAAPARPTLDELLRRHTPLGSFVERNTRRLLDRYRMQGLLRARVPERRPENVWIPFRDDERALYERIEAYLADFYRRFEAERRGLGFVMTVYRRRLTSSFYAVRRSLERRLAALTQDGSGSGEADLFAEDVEPEDDEGDVAGGSEDERAHLEGFLRELGALGRDSKVERLLSDLEALLKERDTALVFTQYADTMDHLREELRPVYGARVACYSGRGGETWSGEQWTPSRKERIKEAFRRGEIRVLLCTESASEGLNLQTCGVLINFDMPWNPMRVEQRIGRVDRIGQTYREVWIKSYFYANSVEAVIYRRLAERIRWFEEVLGRLQPILHRVGELIESAAMLRGESRDRRLERELTAIGMELDRPESPDLGLDAALAPLAVEPRHEPVSSPVALSDLEAALVDERFAPDPAIEGAWALDWQGTETTVTFSPEVFDRYPDSVELLTYGHPLLDELLSAGEAPAVSEEPSGLGLYRSRNPEPLSLFLLPRAARTEAVTGMGELRRAVASPAGVWTGSAERQAAALFSAARQRRLDELRRGADERRRGEERALVEAARRVLRQAALLTLAGGRRASLFEESLPYGFGREAVEALRQRGAPFAALLDLAAGEDIEARSDDPYFLKIQGRSPEELGRKSKALVAAGKDIVARHTILTGTAGAVAETGGVLERVFFPLAAAEGPASEDEERPFRVVPSSEVRPFANAVPLFDDLDAAVEHEERSGEAGMVESPADYAWASFEGRTVPQPGIFVARVRGEAMNRRVQNGSWCVFRLAGGLPRDGRVVLARHRDASDPETGGPALLRICESATESGEDGSWRRRVVLRPASTDPAFRPLVLEDPEEGELRIVAELVEVLG